MADPKPWEIAAAERAAPTSAPLAPGSLGGLFIPKPVDPYAAPTAAANLTRINQGLAQDTAALPYVGKKASADATKAVADARKAEIEALRAQTEAGPPVDPALAGAIKGLGLDELLMSVDAARREIGGGTATGITGAVMRQIPGSTANDLSGSFDSIQGAVIMEKLQALKDASKTGASGMGALSEREGQRLAASIAALNTGLSDEKMLESLATIERHALALRAVGDGKNPEDPAVAEEYGLNPKRPKREEGTLRGGQWTAARDGTETVVDPTLTGANKRMAAMIKAGKSANEVRAYLETVRPGLSKEVANIDQWVQYSHANPGKPINAMIDRTTRPLTPAGSFMNDAAQAGIGSALGAGVIGVGDMMSGGTLDNLTANPEATRATMAGVADAHPVANFVGQTAGAVAAGIGAEATAARMGVGRIGTMLAGDMLPGIAYGAGSADEGSRLGGAATGGIAGALGGVGGRALGRAVTGVADAGVRRLAEAGIRMTPGQVLGGLAKRTEDRVAGFPLIGDFIQSQRRRGIEDFNGAALREALAPVGSEGVAQIGEAGVGQAQQVIGDAYDRALGGVNVRIDPQFGNDLGAAVGGARAIPRVGEEVSDSMQEIIPPYFTPGGDLNGENVQPLLRELREFRTGYRTDPLGTRVGGRVEQAEDAITSMFERQAPDVMPEFNAANEAYSRLSPLMDAVLAAKNQGGVFMPSQLGSASVSGAKKYAGRNAAARGDRAFFDLQRAGQDVLPSQIPDSGSAGRWFIPGALGVGSIGGAGVGAANADGSPVEGAGGGLASGAALTAALLSPYLARGALQRVLTANRNPAVQWAGDALGRSRLPGALALPLLASGE